MNRRMFTISHNPPRFMNWFAGNQTISGEFGQSTDFIETSSIANKIEQNAERIPRRLLLRL